MVRMGVVGFWLAVALAAVDHPTPTPLRAGGWGGEGTSLQVDAGRVAIEWGCASGSIARVPALDDKGRFSVEGTYLQERPGPTRAGEDKASPARYDGAVTGDTLVLKVTLAGAAEPVGTFTFTYGKRTVVRKCG